MFVFFICFAVFMLVSSYDTMKIAILLLVLCIFPLVMVPYILDKIKLYKMDENLIFIYYVFLILALVLGSILGFYHKIWWFDLLCHFISGFLTSLIGFILLKNNKLASKKYKWFGFIFILMFSVSIAAIWEYFEFTIDLFGGDTQHALETGVRDTMEDMLIATLAGIISSIYYLYYLKKSKEGK